MLAINRQYAACARTIDAGSVQVRVPMQFLNDIPNFIGALGQLTVIPDSTAKIIINERTGTVVVGHHVRISSVQIAHGNLTIKPSVTLTPPPTTTPPPPPADQPGPPPKENEDPIEDILKSIKPRTLPPPDGNGRPLSIHDVEQTFSVADLARALTALGATPRDMIAIFQLLKESGALHADVVFN
jgi:flagellar P-ring protein precursor FlgI